jgi:3-deoxy-D-manno-octulosonate 8-phosphate phosphatase (KDO 8-P phosphatase)
MAIKKKSRPKKLSPTALKARLKNLKVLILDIDGIMTDARIIWIEGTGWTSFYSVRDGFGIRQLMKNGIHVALISGGNFESMKKRAAVLKIEHVHLGDENKIVPYQKVKAALGVTDMECAFVGDELFDMPVLREVGFSATVKDGAPQVKKIVHFITKNPGGHGAVREITDMILQAKGLLPE